MATAHRRTEQKAFEGAVLEELPALYRTALRLTKDKADAEDLVQDTYVKALRALDQLKEVSGFRGWVFKILTRTFIDKYRKRLKEPPMVGYEEIEDFYLYNRLAESLPYGTSENPEQRLLKVCLDDDVQAALEELPSPFRIVVLFSDVEGFAYQEISEILGLSVGTVRSRLYRGRRLLQRSLWEYAQRHGYQAERKRASSARPARPGAKGVEP